MNSSDRQLIDGIRNHDEDSFEVLMTRYQDVIQRHIVRIVRDTEAAGDLVQEVFLRIWTRSDQWNGRGGVRQWLFTIATNLALNHLRTISRRREQPLDQNDRPRPARPADDHDEAPSWMADRVSEGAEDVVMRRVRFAQLRALVDDLPEEKRAVWRLVHESDMDFGSAAEALGIPEGTVKSRMHHARKLLAREWNAIVDEWENIN